MFRSSRGCLESIKNGLGNYAVAPLAVEYNNDHHHHDITTAGGCVGGVWCECVFWVLSILLIGEEEEGIFSLPKKN